MLYNSTYKEERDNDERESIMTVRKSIILLLLKHQTVPGGTYQDERDNDERETMMRETMMRERVIHDDSSTEPTITTLQ